MAHSACGLHKSPFSFHISVFGIVRTPHCPNVVFRPTVLCIGVLSCSSMRCCCLALVSSAALFVTACVLVVVFQALLMADDGTWEDQEDLDYGR